MAIYSQKENFKIKSAKMKKKSRFSIARTQPKFKKNRKISIHGYKEGSKKKRRNALKKLVSYLACSQIWLNVPMDDRHFGYVTQNWPQKQIAVSVGTQHTRRTANQ